MKLIIGLGNPGKQYEKTRHNVGFEVIDLLAKHLNVTFKLDKAFKGEIASTQYGLEKIILLKPSTFMNLSGESAILVKQFYKIELEDIMVVYDDIALDLGKLRLRMQGSSGGHNGIKDLVKHFGSQSFKRIRIGISGTDKALCAHVLGKFSKAEQTEMSISYQYAKDALIEFIEQKPFVDIMTKYNTPASS
ncbi:MAG: aminoacyl-tRNA hydrolase [Acholeplasma sp.]|nr:aminoacyl-tRNA hydrolase [Acholeplasma sp.]